MNDMEISKNVSFLKFFLSDLRTKIWSTRLFFNPSLKEISGLISPQIEVSQLQIDLLTKCNRQKAILYRLQWLLASLPVLRPLLVRGESKQRVWVGGIARWELAAQSRKSLTAESLMSINFYSGRFLSIDDKFTLSGKHYDNWPAHSFPYHACKWKKVLQFVHISVINVHGFKSILPKTIENTRKYDTYKQWCWMLLFLHSNR